MKKAGRKMLWAFLALTCVTGSLAASDAVIKGVVTDSAGKPLRGATISVASGIKTVSRFSQKDGKYEITVAGGTYAVSVEAYGFAVKRMSVETTKGGETNFSLSTASLNLARLTGSELESLLPDTPEARLLKARCIECHSFPTVLHRRGQTAAEWKAFLPDMTRGTMNEPFGRATTADGAVYHAHSCFARGPFARFVMM